MKISRELSWAAIFLTFSVFDIIRGTIIFSASCARCFHIGERKLHNKLKTFTRVMITLAKQQFMKKTSTKHKIRFFYTPHRPIFQYHKSMLNVFPFDIIFDFDPSIQATREESERVSFHSQNGRKKFLFSETF